MLSVLKNDGRWNFSRQEESPNPSYHQSKDCSKVDWEDFYDRHCPSTFHLNFNCHSQAQWLSLWAWFFSSTKDYVLGRWNSQGSDCFNREMKMSFIAQDFDKLNIITVLEGRTQTIIRNHFLRYDRSVRCQVKIITMDMFSPYYDLAKHLFPNAKIILDHFHPSLLYFWTQAKTVHWTVLLQHLGRTMSRVRVQIMN